MNGHLFAAEGLHAKAEDHELQWVCIRCKMVLRSMVWYPRNYPRDKRKPDCYPLTSCAEYKKIQADKVISLDQWKASSGR